MSATETAPVVAEESVQTQMPDWRILFILLVVVVLAVLAYKKGMIPGMGKDLRAIP